MQAKIPYGCTELSVDIPNSNLLLIAKPKQKILAAENEEQEIKNALNNPIGSSTLKEMATQLKPNDKVVILTSDYTRHTPSEKIINYLIEEMSPVGVSLNQITVVFASGLHRPMIKGEINKAIGSLSSKLNTLSHDAYNHECVSMGKSNNGTPIEINRAVAEAKLKISISAIDPHHAAGYSGGGKNVMPGVSSRDSILAHHKQMLSPGVAIGALSGNPFREDIEEIASKVGINFIFNVILTEDRKISRAFCGDVIKAHHAGAKVCEELVSLQLQELADIVIVSPGGSPKDKEFWQTEGKALTRIRDVIKPGGVVILVSECPEGVGQEEFKKYIDKYLINGDFDAALETIKDMPFTVATNKIARLAKLLQNNTLFFVTSEAMRNVFPNSPFQFFASLQEALDKALERKGNSAKVLVVPVGPGILLKPPKK
ncbi:MAG: nickel-dependent lactate racemase [Peptococcaceae bacterium]